MARPEDVVIEWPICCFDNRNAKPLPLETRLYVLDESEASEEQKGRILDLIQRTEIPAPDHPLELGQATVTVIQEAYPPNKEILKYRHLFKECSIQKLRSIENEITEKYGPFTLRTVMLMPEYIEDESGNPITQVEMMDYLAGGPVVIMGDPESVTRFGPGPAREIEAWTSETANTMAHFFQVVDHIASTHWYRSPSMLTTGRNQKIIQSAFPSTESTLGVLVLLRQLYSSDPKDDLFNRACGTYLRHVDDKCKADWVKQVKTIFNQMLAKPPHFIGEDFPFSSKELLEAILYGAGLIHARGKDSKCQEQLRDMLRTFPRERLVMAFHGGMKELFWQAATVYPVIKQDFSHWITDLGLSRPELIDITKLLSGSIDLADV